MKQAFFIPGPLPCLNDMLEANRYRGHAGRNRQRWNAYAAMKKQHGEAIQWHLRRYAIQPVQRVSFVFVWHELHRQRDPDNFTSGGRKIILDALVEAGILANDGWKQIVGWSDQWVVNKEQSGVLVEMEERDT